MTSSRSVFSGPAEPDLARLFYLVARDARGAQWAHDYSTAHPALMMDAAAAAAMDTLCAEGRQPRRPRRSPRSGPLDRDRPGLRLGAYRVARRHRLLPRPQESSPPAMDAEQGVSRPAGRWDQGSGASWPSLNLGPGAQPGPFRPPWKDPRMTAARQAPAGRPLRLPGPDPPPRPASPQPPSRQAGRHPEDRPVTTLQSSLGALLGSSHRAPKTKLVAVFPDGREFVIGRKGRAWWWDSQRSRRAFIRRY